MRLCAIVSSFVILFSATTTLGQVIDPFKRIDKPNYGHDLGIEGPLWGALKATTATWDQWGWGWVPERCKQENERFSPPGCNIYDMEVYNVHYEDVPTSWTLCRCNNAKMSILQIVDAFGRLPVRTRQWVRHPIVAPGSGSTSGWQYDKEVVFNGNAYVLTVWMHETSHMMDQWAITADGARYSISKTWLDAINRDSHVSDSYGATNAIEEFGQIAIIAEFDKIIPGGFGTVEPHWEYIYNQYTAAQIALGNNIIPGGTCERRWSDSKIISMGPATGNGRVAGAGGRVRAPKPEYMPQRNLTGIAHPVIDMSESVPTGEPVIHIYD